MKPCNFFDETIGFCDLKVLPTEQWSDMGYWMVAMGVFVLLFGLWLQEEEKIRSEKIAEREIKQFAGNCD